MEYRLPPISLDPVADAEELALAAMGRGGAPAAAAPPRMLRRATRPRSEGGAVTTVVQPGEENIRRGLDLMSAEDDYSSAQEYASKRGIEGEGALLNALAAQYAGDRFAPVQQMYLKRSLASQDPLRVGSAMISPDGSVMKDPSASREREAGRLLQLGQFEMTLADRKQAREDAERSRQEGRALQLSLAGMRGTAGPSDASMWRAEDKLRNDFNAATGDLSGELSATRKITEIISAMPPGTRPDAITQQSLVILLNKFLDPGSVVREGEFDRVVKAQGLEGRANNLKAYLLRGEPLNDEAIRQIGDLAGLYQRAAETRLRSTASQYSEVARTRGLDPAAVIVNPAYRANSVSADDPLGLRGP